HPWWTERARLFVPPELPVVGYLGDTSDDLIAHPRIWVLANRELPRTPEADFRRAFLPDRTPLAEPRRSGPLALTLSRTGPPRSVLPPGGGGCAGRDFPAGGRGTGPGPAQRPGRRVVCPSAASAEVAWPEVVAQPVRCLFLIPPSGGRT